MLVAPTPALESFEPFDEKLTALAGKGALSLPPSLYLVTAWLVCFADSLVRGESTDTQRNILVLSPFRSLKRAVDYVLNKLVIYTA